MTELESPNVEISHRNEDPISHEPGAHPIATGVGAAGGGATGAAVGMLVGGPVGGVIGAVLGAVAGGLSGSAVGEAVDPTITRESILEDEQIRDRSEPKESLGSATEYSIAPNGQWEQHSLPRTDGLVDLKGQAAVAKPATLSRSSHEDIALLAWCYYAAEGFVDGRQLEHWFRAEGELQRLAEEKYAEPIRF